MPLRVSILGVTGSIGQQALAVIRQRPYDFVVVGLAAGHDTPAFRALMEEFRPQVSAVAKGEESQRDNRILVGKDGLNAVASVEADIVLMAIPGMAALPPTLAAIEAGRDIALASKEVLVAAGRLVKAQAKKHNITIYPVDSEHSAIWQSSRGDDPSSIRQLWLTASGGAFRDRPVDELALVTPKEALQHPTWNMGPKVTVDSATMMNKGLEMIEAHHLFDVPYDDIQVVIHRESLVHSMVEFTDGGFIAALSNPDMRLPISLALQKGVRVVDAIPALRFETPFSMHFEPLDGVRYPAVAVARAAGKQGGSAPCALNAANEVATEAFLSGLCPFTDIVPMVEFALNEISIAEDDELEEIEAVDTEVREYLRRVLKNRSVMAR